LRIWKKAADLCRQSFRLHRLGDESIASGVERLLLDPLASRRRHGDHYNVLQARLLADGADLRSNPSIPGNWISTSNRSGRRVFIDDRACSAMECNWTL
jgi:hypothetical protein